MRRSVLAVVLCSLLAVIFYPGAVHAVASVSLADTEFQFFFNKPKSIAQPYEENVSIILTNLDENNTVSVSNLAASVSDISGFSAVISETSTSIPGGGSKSIILRFRASPDMAEGVHRGRLVITGTGIEQYSASIKVEIYWPEPALNATWDKKEWGNVKAGGSFTQVLKVKEVMGYKPVSNVVLRIGNFGPAKLSYISNVGNIEPGALKNVYINVSVPDRNLKPDVYFVKPILSANGTVSIKTEDAFYSIPTPEIEIEEDMLDFGKLTFEPGKDVSDLMLVVKETGGYTPIEGINITLNSGEKGWISYPSISYISPNSSATYPFTIRLPTDASLGEKSWEFMLKTAYAGSYNIRTKVLVYFPGVEDAIKDLQKIASNVTEHKTIVSNTISLLENSRGETAVRKIATVMSVYSSSRAFLNLIEEAQKSKDDLDKAANSMILAKNALNKIKIGNENLKDQYTAATVKSAEAVWNSTALEILELITEKAEASRNVNYKAASMYYKRISEIYYLLGESKNAQEYAVLQAEIEDRYKNALSKAINLKLEGTEELTAARNKMFSLGDGRIYFILNPLYYDFISRNYEDAIKKYTEAENLYKAAGETSDAELVSSEIRIVKRQEAMLKTAFLAYGMFWSILFIWFAIRISIGLQRFRQDEEELSLGDVILAKSSEGK